MRRETHIAFGFALGFLIGDTLVASILNGMISALGAWFPDLDLKYKHRALLHNLFFPVILLISIPFIPYAGSSLSLTIKLFVLGWVSHLLTDALTVSGVALFYPLTSKKSGVALFRSNSPAANLLIIALSAALAYAKVSSSYYNIPLPQLPFG